MNKLYYNHLIYYQYIEARHFMRQFLFSPFLYQIFFSVFKRILICEKSVFRSLKICFGKFPPFKVWPENFSKTAGRIFKQTEGWFIPNCFMCESSIMKKKWTTLCVTLSWNLSVKIFWISNIFIIYALRG